MSAVDRKRMSLEQVFIYDELLPRLYCEWQLNTKLDVFPVLIEFVQKHQTPRDLYLENILNALHMELKSEGSLESKTEIQLFLIVRAITLVRDMIHTQRKQTPIAQALFASTKAS